MTEQFTTDADIRSVPPPPTALARRLLQTAFCPSQRLQINPITKITKATAMTVNTALV